MLKNVYFFRKKVKSPQHPGVLPPNPRLLPAADDSDPCIITSTYWHRFARVRFYHKTIWLLWNITQKKQTENISLLLLPHFCAYFTLQTLKKMIIIWPHLKFLPRLCWAGYGPVVAPEHKVIKFNELNLYKLS